MLPDLGEWRRVGKAEFSAYERCVHAAGGRGRGGAADIVLLGKSCATSGSPCRSRVKRSRWPPRGIGLSLIAMLFAAAGYRPPMAGAIRREGIDVLVIVNALFATRGNSERKFSKTCELAPTRRRVAPPVVGR